MFLETKTLMLVAPPKAPNPHPMHMRKVLRFLYELGIHLNRTRFREHGHVMKACRTCLLEWCPECHG
jgi:hypothetical protein